MPMMMINKDPDENETEVGERKGARQEERKLQRLEPKWLDI